MPVFDHIDQSQASRQRVKDRFVDPSESGPFESQKDKYGVMPSIPFYLKIKPYLSGKFFAVKILPPLLFIAGFLLLVHYAKEWSPNQNDAKLKELETLAGDTQVFPDFTEIASSTSSRAMDAGVYKSYRSAANFADVRRFYVAALQQKGWILSKGGGSEFGSGDDEESEFEFKKGEFRIVVEYAGRNISPVEWNYSVNFVWHNES
jgi:hypothetical protein